MIHYTLFSHFSDSIKTFVEYKNSLGYPYEDSSRVLWNFDSFCVKYFPDDACLNREIGLAWSVKKESETNAGLRNRVMVIREFAKYLCSTGEEAYIIPISLVRKPKKPIPHIFTTEELSSFFRATDSFEYHMKAPARHLVIPAFFRLLYCCGLRPSEARLLLKENVDLERGVIKIIESKGHKDRFVALSNDITQLCRNYQDKIDKIFPLCQYFFPRYDGEKYYTKLWTEEMFWRCWDMAGITEFSGSKPRVYDFRHNFATNCIYRWVSEGKDADALIPYLSAYMGHVQQSDTAYYIHLVPEFFLRMTKLDVLKYETLIPEVAYED